MRYTLSAFCPAPSSSPRQRWLPPPPRPRLPRPPPFQPLCGQGQGWGAVRPRVHSAVQVFALQHREPSVLITRFPHDLARTPCWVGARCAAPRQRCTPPVPGAGAPPVCCRRRHRHARRHARHPRPPPRPPPCRARCTCCCGCWAAWAMALWKACAVAAILHHRSVAQQMRELRFAPRGDGVDQPTPRQASLPCLPT